MKRVSSRSLLAVAIGTVVWTGCMNPSSDTTTETASEPLVLNRSQMSGAEARLLLPATDLLERPVALRRPLRSRSLAHRSHRSDRSDERLDARQRRRR